MNTITRLVALPLLSAGILGGALGLAGTAGAATGISTGGSHSAVAGKDTTSHNPTVHTWRDRHRDSHNTHWRH